MDLVDPTIRLTDILLFVLTIGAAPLIRVLVKTLFGMRDDVRDLKREMGCVEPPHGVLGDIGFLRHQVSKNRDQIIRISAETKVPFRDRS